ncbi:MAG TPA: hypothetical protein VGD46_04155 [Rhizobacter sp.]
MQTNKLGAACAARLDALCVRLGFGQPLNIPEYQLRGRWRFWAGNLIRRKPHLVIHQDGEINGTGKVYMRRWWLLPKNRWLNVYLHCFDGPDHSPLLHDHPYDNVSIILRGGYIEKLLQHDVREDIALESDRVAQFPVDLVAREAGDVIVRRADSPHTIHRLLAPGTWTLFLTGPTVRHWGFHTPTGWKFWKTHLGVEA